jgi:hypothetical protein
MPDRLRVSQQKNACDAALVPRMISSEKSATFQDHGLDAAHDPV